MNVIEFTSTRKRMTVIVKSEDTNQIRVMCKGADSILLPRIAKKNNSDVIEKTQLYLDEFSKEGLRTLVLAEKFISHEEYSSWNKQYQAALIST